MVAMRRDMKLAHAPTRKVKALSHQERGSVARKEARGKKRRQTTRTSTAFAMLAEKRETRLVSVLTKTTSVAPGFKDKTRYTPYVCPGIQFTHIVTNEGVISKTMPLLHSA